MAKDVVSGLVYAGRDAAHLYMPTSPGELHAVALLGRAHAGVQIDAGTIERNLESELTDVQTLEAVSLDDMVTIQMFPLRMASWVGSVLAAVALVLSLSGLYGVLTYVLGQRRQEIGIRMALGASAAAVVQLVMRQSARFAMVGGMAGLIVAFAALKVLAAFVRLQNVALVDPVAFAVASVLAALAVAAASYAPARRATQVDPARVLRTEA